MKKSWSMKATLAMLLAVMMSLSAFAIAEAPDGEEGAPAMNPFAITVDAEVTVDDDFVVLHPGETQKINFDVEITGELPQGLPEMMMGMFTTPSIMTANAKVARMDAEGNITAVSEGVADLTIVVANKARKTIAVTVVPEKDETDRVKMGIQMFNFNIDLNASEDQGRTSLMILRRLAAMGYDGVEWVEMQFTDGKLFGAYDAEQVKAYIDELGLESAGLHPMGMTEQTVELCKTLDVPLLWASTSLTADVDLDPAVIDASVEQVNTVEYPAAREMLEGTGVEIMYHNHGEFGKTSDGDYALNKIDYDWQQLDFYWAMKGLQSYEDAMAYLEERADKIGTIHLKDGTMDVTRTDDITPWGMGEFELQKVLDVASSHDNIRWIIVESDSPANNGLSGIEDAGVTMEYAKGNLDLTRVD